MRRAALRRTARCLIEPDDPAGEHPRRFRRDEPVPDADPRLAEQDRPEVLIKERLRLGWIGLGDMGMGMAWKVAMDPSHSLHVWTRNERKLHAYAAMIENQMRRHIFQRPQLLDVPRFADAIFVSLGTIRAVREVLLERDDAVLFNAREGSIVVDHSSVDLDTTAECHRIAAARGVRFIDAPVAGSPELASTGNLTVMAGGDQQAVRRVAGVIGKYAHCLEWMGPSGSGTKAKMVHEQAAALHAAASAETAILARALEIRDLDKLTRVCDSSLGGSNMLRRNAAYWPAQFTSRAKVATGQTVSRTVRSLAIVDDFVRRSDAATPAPPGADDTPGPLHRSLGLTRATTAAFVRCGEAGGHDADVSSVVHFLDPGSSGGDIVPVAWDVPVGDEVRNAQLRSRIERDDVDAEAQRQARLDDVDEFDGPSGDASWSAPGTAPRLDPAQLYRLYSRARPRSAAPGGGSGGRVVRAGGWDPAQQWAHIPPLQKAGRLSMERFAEVGVKMDATLGKASFGAVPFHQRAAPLVNPISATVIPGAPGAEAGAGGAEGR